MNWFETQHIDKKTGLRPVISIPVVIPVENKVEQVTKNWRIYSRSCAIVAGPGQADGNLSELHWGIAFNLLLTQHRGSIDSLASPQKKGLYAVEVNTHWQRHIVRRQSDPALYLVQNPSSKVTDVLLNAKSRNVSWRLHKFLWDRVLEVGSIKNTLDPEEVRANIFSALMCSTVEPSYTPGTNMDGDFEQTVRTELIVYCTSFQHKWTQVHINLTACFCFLLYIPPCICPELDVMSSGFCFVVTLAKRKKDGERERETERHCVQSADRWAEWFILYAVSHLTP